MRHLAHILFPILLALGLLGMSGCNNKKGEATDSGNGPETFLAGLNDTGKVGQVLCYTVDPIHYFVDSQYREKVKDLLEVCHPGAIYLFSDLNLYPKHVLTEFDPVKLRGIVSEIQNLIGSPCLFAGSMETGAWYWGAKTTRFPLPIALGATGSPAFAYRQGKITSVEAVGQGINWVLAPVVNNIASSMGEQESFLCFGDNPARIGEFIAQYVKGVQDVEAAACLKYYPGPEADAENSPGAAPLKAGIAAGVLSIMGNPLSIGSDSPEGNPSSDACRDILSTEFGFKGVVVREVEGVEDSSLTWTAKAENILRSFARGQDVVILPDNPDTVLPLMEQLVSLVQLKKADMNTILPSVKKVVLLKDKLKLHQPGKSDILFTSGVGIPEYTRTAEDIFRASLTLLRNDGNLLPLDTRNKHLLFANFIDTTASDLGIRFSDNLFQTHPEIHQINVLNASDSRIIMELLRRVSDSDMVVCTFFLNGEVDGKLPSFTKSQTDLLHRISRSGKPCVGVSFSSPYLVNDIPDFKAFLTTYCLLPFTLNAVNDVLFGKAGTTGKLPMTVSARYPSGSGISIGTPSQTGSVATAPAGYDAKNVFR